VLLKELPNPAGRVVEVAWGVLSAHRDKLIEEGLLDLSEFGTLHTKLMVQSGWVITTAQA
jgi:hypothetical protein